ncbi:MAG TPA: Bax inhibitor-1/YccA family protein [Candidatus Limnocylindria bacterium]|nr:Bax inhibitor-1/YccA family protein [Candidatus Limnocylindria bacterium]
MTFQPNQPGGGLGHSGTDRIPVPSPSQSTVAVQGAFLTQAFFWMFAGLMVTAAIAAFAQFNPALQEFAARNFIILVIAQLALAIGIQWGINRIGATVALGLFFIYAASLGVTIGLIVSLYTGESVATAFLSAGAMFGGAALYGYTTKRSLASIGAFAYMAVIGLFVAILVNWFLASSALGYIISIIGVILFTILTAWDVQRISSGQLVAQLGSVEKAAVIGALHLYLDFVNLFLFLLRLTGGRR